MSTNAKSGEQEDEGGEELEHRDRLAVGAGEPGAEDRDQQPPVDQKISRSGLNGNGSRRWRRAKSRIRRGE